MKIFHRDKYQYENVIVNPLDNLPYYAFRCIKSNFSPEIILVDEAKMIYGDSGYVYFEKEDLKSLQCDENTPTLLCLKPGCVTAKNLAENESKWRKRRLRSEVVTLTYNEVHANKLVCR